MKTPKISVVMINYNGMPWLEDSVNSVMSSECADFELVVADDMSSDGSREFINAAAKLDRRIVPHFLSENSGISAARNAGISKARGEFISIIDSDDLFLKDTLDRQLDAFLEMRGMRPNHALLTSDAWLINEKGERKGRYISSAYWGKSCYDDPPLWTLPSTFFFRKEGAPHFHNGYRSADAPIFIRRMLAAGGIGFIGEPMIEYRLRMSSVTNDKGEFMLREMSAAEASARDGRLDNPYSADEMPSPPRSQVRAWTHGRNAKNAAANGRSWVAISELIKATASDPRKTFSKLGRSIRSKASSGKS